MRTPVVTIGLAAALTLTAAGSRPAPPQGESRPKLVVLLMVDQMRADYLDRYKSLYEHGLARLMEHGAWYQKAALPYLDTVTCAGHATAGTGTFPYKHGMIMNAWYIRDAGAVEACTEDPSTKEVPYGPYGGPGDSARRLMQPALAELLHQQGGQTVSISLKARSAIGMGGHEGTAIVWFDERLGWFTSSTAFTRQTTPALSAFVKAHPIDRDRGSIWERLLPPARYQYEDDVETERPSNGWGVRFPHALGDNDRTFYARWEQSPFSDEYLEQMAEAAVDGLKLGQGGTTDFLGVSFSALDLVGHIFGPRSHEVQDVLARLDVTIDRLIAHLDSTVGRDRYILALSADHGVSDIPEQVSGGRLPNEAVVRIIDQVLGPILKDAPPASLDDLVRPFVGEGVYVASIANTDVYLRNGVYHRVRAIPGALDTVIAGLKLLPSVERVLRSDELASPAARQSADPVVRAAALSYVPGRSGDLVLVLSENSIASSAAATHGTARDYDQAIPLIFYGAGVRPGVYDDAASSADIAASFAARIGVRLTAPDGRPLSAVVPASGSGR